MLLAVISGGFALLGALLGTLITGFFGLRAKRNEYVNDYYKKVIDRRIAAYEQLERLIVSLRTTSLGEANKPCHRLFLQDEGNGFIPAYQILHDIALQALWLSEEAFDTSRELNQLLARFQASGGNDAIAFGQQNYLTLATLREHLEKILAADMLGLHDVRRFLRKKKARPDLGLQPWG
jgi:hypothetical protein